VLPGGRHWCQAGENHRTFRRKVFKIFSFERTVVALLRPLERGDALTCLGVEFSQLLLKEPLGRESALLLRRKGGPALGEG
jgi:hypothetical protein